MREELNKEEARQAEAPGIVRWILVWSLVIAVAGMGIVAFVY